MGAGLATLEPVSPTRAVSSNAETATTPVELDFVRADADSVHRRLFEALPDGVLVFGLTGRVLLANPSARRMLGDGVLARSGEAVGLPLVAGDKCVIDIVGSNGEPRVAELRTIPATWEGQPAVVAMLRDITENHRTATALERSERRFRELFLNLGSGLLICSFDPASLRWLVREANRAAGRIEGVEPEEFVGLSLVEALPEFAQPPLVEAVQRACASGGPLMLSPRFFESARRPGWREYAIWELASHELAIVYEDVSSAKETERALQHAQKMEAIGELAGGVAHEFNNLLQTLIGAIQVLQCEPSPATCASLLPMLETRIRHGASIVRQLLVFGRREVPRHEVFRLDELVRSSSRFLRPILRANIAFDVDAGIETWVEGDRGQLEQVIVNLVVNAADAMPEGGLISLTAQEQDGIAMIEVRDTGPGIAPEIRERIFEPFFTTKGDRGGAGLGLAVVHGIVRAHRGTIEVSSDVSVGAALRVRVPAHPRPAAASLAAVRSEDRLRRGQGERVLLVEDEEGPRETLAEMLGILGYEVTTVSTAEAALSAAASARFDLVLTDFMLPGANGHALVRELGRRAPGTAFVMLSGYAAQPGIADDVSAGTIRFLNKPCDMETLGTELATALVEARERRPAAGAQPSAPGEHSRPVAVSADEETLARA